MTRLVVSFLLTVGVVLAVLHVLGGASLFGNRQRRFFRKRFLHPVVNPLLYRLHVQPVWLLPVGDAHADLHTILHKITHLDHTIRQTLTGNCYFDPLHKSELISQLSGMPENIVALSWKLEQLYEVRAIIDDDSETGRELDTLADNLREEIHSAATTVEILSVSLLKLELAGNEDAISRLLEDLSAANRRMRDLLEAHAMVQKHYEPDT